MVRIKKQSKFIKKGKQIFYVDKWGRKWDNSCLDDVFESITQRKRIEEKLDYYSYNE